jgi:hypothetical protein
VLAAAPALAEPYYLIVAGLGGEASYAAEFEQQADELATAARRTVGDESRVVVLTGKTVSRDAMQKAFQTMARNVKQADSAIVFLLGHGSYDGEHYKFNIPGPDVDGEEIGQWLGAVPARAQLIVDATSASGAALDAWVKDGRTVITATRSGAERNATRFGEHWAEALSSPEADTNKDEVITTQEAFDFAASKVKDSYDTEGTLATEHPQLKGDGAVRLTVARLTERKERTPEVEALYSKLGDLEDQIEQLRQRRDQLDGDTYLNQLQPLLVELATVQQQIDASEGQGAAGQGAEGQGAEGQGQGAKGQDGSDGAQDESNASGSGSNGAARGASAEELAPSSNGAQRGSATGIQVETLPSQERLRPAPSQERLEPAPTQERLEPAPEPGQNAPAGPNGQAPPGQNGEAPGR